MVVGLGYVVLDKAWMGCCGEEIGIGIGAGGWRTLLSELTGGYFVVCEMYLDCISHRTAEKVLSFKHNTVRHYRLQRRRHNSGE